MQLIPGVSLAVLYEGRCLFSDENPGSDDVGEGYLGELASGTLEIRALVQPRALVYGIRRWGDDSYDLQKDQAACEGVDGGVKLYRATMGLEANWETCEPFVPYSNNMLLLAELIKENGFLTNRVHIWRVAVVSQEGRFFLAVQKGYDTTAHQDGAGRAVFPRLRAHPQLETILVRLRPNADGTITYPRCALAREKCHRRERVQTDLVTDVAKLPPLSDFVSESEPALLNLRDHEGHVVKFYDARGMGTLLTPLGIARFNWRDCPARPRRRYLVAGERVRYERLGAPVPHRPNLRYTGDKLRPGRSSNFRRQAFGVTICS